MHAGVRRMCTANSSEQIWTNLLTGDRLPGAGIATLSALSAWGVGFLPIGSQDDLNLKIECLISANGNDHGP